MSLTPEERSYLKNISETATVLRWTCLTGWGLLIVYVIMLAVQAIATA